MKRPLIQAFAIILIGGILFAGCKKDETDPPNSFKYNEKEAPIGTAFAGNLGEVSTGSYGYYLYFLENTLKVSYVNSAPDQITGIGDYMMIAIVSSDSTGLKTGEYTYSSSNITFNPNTFGYESGLLIDYDGSTDDYVGVMLFNGGKINVTRNGDEYTFNFSISTTVNSTITGFYKGNIASYALNPSKKSTSKNPLTFPFRK
jgi:hypothetical protein